MSFFMSRLPVSHVSRIISITYVLIAMFVIIHGYAEVDSSVMDALFAGLIYPMLVVHGVEQYHRRHHMGWLWFTSWCTYVFCMTMLTGHTSHIFLATGAVAVSITHFHVYYDAQS